MRVGVFVVVYCLGEEIRFWVGDPDGFVEAIRMLMKRFSLVLADKPNLMAAVSCFVCSDGFEDGMRVWLEV